MTTTAHGRARYVKGCRCGVCREANRAYQRRYRATKLRPVPDVSADTAPPEQAPRHGRLQRIGRSTVVADAVQRQLDDTGAAERRPGLAAAAIKLAELLDNPLAVPQHPQAAGRLVALLGLLAREERHGGRLAAVRSLTER